MVPYDNRASSEELLKAALAKVWAQPMTVAVLDQFFREYKAIIAKP